LQVSAEKLRYQEDDVVMNLITQRVMDWIELEGDKDTKGLLMRPAHPAKLTKRGRGQVFKRLLPSWIRKRLTFLTDKDGVTFNMFQFAFRVFLVQHEEREDKKGAKGGKGSKGNSKGAGKSGGGGAGKGASPSGSTSSAQGAAGAASQSAIMCTSLEAHRHTLSANELGKYKTVGVGSSKREERRQKLVYLMGAARTSGFGEWIERYRKALAALPAVGGGGTGGKGAPSVRGKGGGRGGGAMSRRGRGGKGGKGGKGGMGRGSGTPQNARSLRGNRPGPGFFKGMQALTLSDANQPPAQHAAYHYPHPFNTPHYYNPYQLPSFPSPYAYPTQHAPTDTNETHTSVVEVMEGDGGGEKEEENVGGWDESGQVGTDVEEELPQQTSWADSGGYDMYYGSSQGGEKEEDLYY
jgi:hypothetical protein